MFGTTQLDLMAILDLLALAEDRLAGFDQTLKGSPIRDGFLARSHYLDGIASQVRSRANSSIS